MLSERTLTELFDRTNLRSGGTLATKESRRNSAAHCEISDRDTGKSLVLLTVSEARDRSDADRMTAMVAKESNAVRGCERKDVLSGDGYACVDSEGLVAARANDKRLIRLTIPGDTGRNLSAERVNGLIDEIDVAADDTD